MKNKYTQEYAYAYCELIKLKPLFNSAYKNFEVKNKVLTDAVSDATLGLDTGYTSAMQKTLGLLLQNYQVTLHKDSVTLTFKCKF